MKLLNLMMRSSNVLPFSLFPHYILGRKLRKKALIAISWKRHFRSPKRQKKILCNTKYHPIPRKTHLRKHFWPLESGFSAIVTYKTYVSSKSCNVRILNFFCDSWHLSHPKKLDKSDGGFKLSKIAFCQKASEAMWVGENISVDVLHLFNVPHVLLYGMAWWNEFCSPVRPNVYNVCSQK